MLLWSIMDILYYKDGNLIKGDFMYIQSWISVFSDPDWSLFVD